MSARKVKRKYVRKQKAARLYLECPFCHNKQYDRLGRDETSSWCSNCGKCFSAQWKEETM